MVTNEQIIESYGITNINDRWDVEQSSYTPILRLFGEVVIQCDEDNYQGDTIAVIKNENRYGYIVFGWGSCSGCDALQACDTVEEIVELANSLEQAVHWFETLAELKQFVFNHDYNGDWLDKELVQEFKEEVSNL